MWGGREAVTCPSHRPSQYKGLVMSTDFKTSLSWAQTLVLPLPGCSSLCKLPSLSEP